MSFKKPFLPFVNRRNQLYNFPSVKLFMCCFIKKINLIAILFLCFYQIGFGLNNFLAFKGFIFFIYTNFIDRKTYNRFLKVYCRIKIYKFHSKPVGIVNNLLIFLRISDIIYFAAESCVSFCCIFASSLPASRSLSTSRG